MAKGIMDCISGYSNGGFTLYNNEFALKDHYRVKYVKDGGQLEVTIGVDDNCTITVYIAEVIGNNGRHAFIMYGIISNKVGLLEPLIENDRNWDEINKFCPKLADTIINTSEDAFSKPCLMEYNGNTIISVEFDAKYCNNADWMKYTSNKLIELLELDEKLTAELDALNYRNTEISLFKSFIKGMKRGRTISKIIRGISVLFF